MAKPETIHPIIIIPVFNSRDSLLILLEKIKTVSDLPVMIVDDGSTDGLQNNDLPGLHYLRHSFNQGKGAALKTGLRTARERGYTHALTLDADGQHDPALIPEFEHELKLHPAAMILGARDLNAYNMPFHRKLSNNITSLILSLRTGELIRDAQVGYRCYPLYNSRLWSSHEDGFQFESAVFMNSAKLNLDLIWQQIPVIYGSENSHMHPVQDTLKFIRTMARSFLC